MEKGEYQLAYYYNYSYYLLSADRNKKAEAAQDAVDACLHLGHYTEVERLIFEIETFNTEFTDLLKLKYSYALVKLGQYTKANLYLKNIEFPGNFPDQYYLLRAYTDVNSGSMADCLKNLNLINSSFSGYGEVNQIIKTINENSRANKKHLAISLPLSAVIPGLGQAYSGFYYDALQSFSLNLVFGAGAFSAWKYELTKSKDNRNYVLPGVTTLFFSAFYIANLYNTVNVTQKANLFSESERIRKISEKFDVVLDNNITFIRFRVKL
jgi:hypothetical protein